MNDVDKGLQELFDEKPELFGAVREMIEAFTRFLRATNRDDARACGDAMSDRVRRICDCEEARSIPALRAWAGELDEQLVEPWVEWLATTVEGHEALAALTENERLEMESAVSRLRSAMAPKH